ncbi:unnamed protein product, partial [Brenthis ino]
MYDKIKIISQVVRINSIRYYSKDSSKKLLEFLGTMPKVNTGRIKEVQRQRLQTSKKSEKYGPSTVYLQVLGSGARGAPNTLYLFTDQKRYLFNCGEGSQRLAHEHKVKLSRLEHIFITNKTWRNIGGLPGLSLTLQDVGVPNITLHGPEGLDELYNATRRFVIMKEMNVTMANCSPSVDFEDNVMTVKYVLMYPQDNILQTDPKPAAKKARLGNDSVDKEFEEFIHDDTDYYKREAKNVEGNKNKNANLKPKPTSEKDPVKKKDELVLHDLQKHSHCTVAYICIIKKRLGTLDLEKCVELGVKPGPLLGQLKSGQDVVLPDGTLVLSKDVKTPDDPGPVFIVMEVPDLSYLKESEFSAHFDNGTNPPENIPTVIVHYTPPHVFNHPTYRAFLSLFGPTTRHLVLNTQNTCLGSEATHRTQHKLHLLDGDMFPLLRDASVPAVWGAPAAAAASAALDRPASPLRMRALEELKHNFQNIINMEGCSGGDAGLKNSESLDRLELIAGRTLSIFHLRPKRELDRSMESKLHIQDYIQEAMDADGFVSSLEHFRKLVEDMRYAKRDSQKEYPKVVFLGTGSCIPSKTRNTSAIVLHIDEDRSMLLDCGEGTFGQLVRFYGPKRVNSFLRTLKAIYISHLHADHHIGLIGILQARREALNEVSAEGAASALYLLAPGQIVSWLSVYDQRFERIRNEFTLIPNQSLLQSKQEDGTSTEMTSAVLSHIGVQHIRTCPVAHCPNAFGVAVGVGVGFKLTYSGDTIPCDDLVEIGKDSTLLIHEATMEDELADEARVKMHSTTSQAIEIGKRMNAKYTVLTHFSQRYARLPRLNAHILKDNNSVGIAFDNMQLTMSDLELLPHMYAPLQLMFAEHCVELELKAAQRARLKERRPSPANLPTSGIIRNYSTCSTDYKMTVDSVTDDSTDNVNGSNCNVTDNETISGIQRKRSPCCDEVAAPFPPANQNKEKHCSRLRQERSSRLAGKILSGTRSKSCSPSKISSGNNSPISSKCGSAPHSPERTSEIASHRTPSSSSNISNSKPKCQNFINTNIAHVVDTRSKTLNEASTLTLSYTNAMKMSNNNNKNKSFSETKKSPCTLSINISVIDIVSSILYHLLFWKLHHFVSCISYFQWQLLISVIAVGYLFWTATKTTSARVNPNSQPGFNLRSSTNSAMKSVPTMKSTRQPKTISNLRRQSVERNAPGLKSFSSYTKLKSTHAAYTCGTSSWNAGTSPTRKTIGERVSLIQKNNSKENITKIQANVKSASSSRESLTDLKRKLAFNRNTLPTSFKNFVNYSSKSFKPQLEDIKSSYLLLNKKNCDRNLRQEKNATSKISKPQPLSEKQRKQKLMEAMQKYKTKKYWTESKYDRIEGLNWISWK